MLDDNQPLFHLVITHKDGGVIHRQTGVATITIGSGSDATLVLKSDRLLPLHLRVLVLNAREVLLFNLGPPDSVLLDGRTVEERAATTWQAGHTVILDGDYSLQLIAAGGGSTDEANATQEEDDWLDTQAELDEATQQDAAELPATPLDEPEQETLRTEPPPLPEGPPANPAPELFFNLDADVTAPDFGAAPSPPTGPATGAAWSRTQPEADRSATTPEEPPAPAPIPQFQPQPYPPPAAAALPPPVFGGIQGSATEPEPGQAGLAAETRPGQPFLPGQGLFPPGDGGFFNPPYAAANANDFTLNKAWQTAGLLSAQLPMLPINVAPGERIRIPVSVRNQYNQTVTLQSILLGLPDGWTVITQPRLTLESQEVGALDLVVQAHPGLMPGQLDAVIRLVEVATPTITISLPFRIIVKSAPDLVGALEPARIRDSGVAFLRLQNHTQSEARIHLSGHSESRYFHALPGQDWLDLPGGQSSQVKISINVRKRPWIRGVRRGFSVSAKEGSRAPLDFAGSVFINPHIPLLFFLWLLVVTGILVFALLTNGTITLPTGGTGEQPRPAQTEEVGETPSPGLSLPVFIPGSPAQTEEVTGDDLVATTEEVTTDYNPVAATEEVVPPGAPAATAAPSFDDPRPASCQADVPAGWMVYTVRRGDTVFRLAQSRGTSIAEIVRVNCLPSSRQIRTGQVLLLPMPGD